MKKHIMTLIGVALAIGMQAQNGLDPNLPTAFALEYNNDINVELGVGLWGTPIPTDYDKDGVNDLIVSCSCIPYNGLFYFRNVGTNKVPLFDKAVKIGDKALNNICVSSFDGKQHLLGKEREYTEFFDGKFFSKHVSINYEGERIPTMGVRSEMWNYVDWDGDGDADILVGIDTWSEYGWDNAYDKDGNWTNGPLRGWVYLLENIDGKYFNRGRIQAGGVDLETFGAPAPCIADWDGDGDLDIICGEFVDGLTWYENVGTRQNPQFAAGKQLRNAKGEVRFHLEMIMPVPFDWDCDGKMDLVVGDEDGTMALLRNSGKVKKHMPQFEPIYKFQQKADLVKFGALATPWSYDWDGDGQEDIIAGNSAGEIAFIRNRGNGESWDEPRFFTVNGKPLRIMAGPNGSIQGPAERKWGYTVLTVADWDGDGLADIIVNSIWGKIEWLRGLGGLKLAPAQPVQVAWGGETPKPAWNWWQPKPETLSTQWRTTPVAMDWDNDGRCDLIVLDHEGYLSYFHRREDGRLDPGQRIFVCTNCSTYTNSKDFTTGKGGVLRMNELAAGKSGRRKICFADWNKDGVLDLIVDGPNARWFKGLGEKNGQYLLQYMGDMSSTLLEGHTTSPTVVDWDKDGIADLLLGAEDGHFYFVKNPMADYDECVKLYGEGVMPCEETVDEKGYIWGTIEPELLVYEPKEGTATNKAILVVPGGGYEKNCITFEGYKTANWLADNGITAFILKYRLPNGKPEVTLQDGEAAISYIRQNAGKYGVDPHSIGVIGFSAGGHFCSTLLTKYNSLTTRPDFGILTYPVISSDYENAKTHEKLLGDKLKEDGPRWTATNYVNPDMPPIMILMCSDDKTVPTQQVKDFYDAAISAGCNIQLHFYPYGDHGFWMRDRFRYADEIYPMVLNWIMNPKK